MKRILRFLFLLVCLPAVAQSNVAVLVHSELRDCTNVMQWATVDATDAVCIVTINLTNPPTPPKTNVLVSFDAIGTVEMSSNLSRWDTVYVRYTNTFEWPIDNDAWFFRDPAVPAEYPTNPPILRTNISGPFIKM